jgi:hypothetical protein
MWIKLSSALRVIACGLGLLISAAACGRSQAQPTTPAKTSTVAAHHGRLTDYVTAAGLRWMLVGSPRVFADSPDFLAAFEHLVPKDRLDAFAKGSGVNLRTLPEGCIAGFDYGTIYLARVGKETSHVRERFEARLVSEAVTKSAAPGVWRVTGLVANTPESLLTVDDDFAAISVGDPLLVRVAESFALGKFKKTSPALAGAALSTLPKDLELAPLRFYAPGPFAESWAKGVDGLLARAYAVGATVSPGTEATLKLHLVISGAFGPDLEESRIRILKTWAALLNSPVGHVLELEHAVVANSFELEVDGGQAILDVSLNANLLIKGLSAAVQADTRALFDW